MQKQIHLLGILSILIVSAVPSLASAAVMAMPSFFDFGSVEAGDSARTTITFINESPLPLQFFNVSCSGDFTDYNCFSMCSMMPPFGSCMVQVQFNPRNGDGLQRMLMINGSGNGGFASATVYGTDAKKTTNPSNAK